MRVLELPREPAELLFASLPGCVRYDVEAGAAQRCARALRELGAEVDLRMHRADAPRAAGTRAAAPRSLGRGPLIAICGAIIVGCGVYVFVQLREALREPSEKERIARRLMPEEASYFTTSSRPGLIIPYPAPDESCRDAARPELRRAEELAAAWDVLGGAAEPAQRALEIDPDCVPAANILLLARARKGTQIALNERFVGRADKQAANAAAQLEAALYQREVGNPDGMLAYLERARKARPGQPLLEAAFGQYAIRYADPLDYRAAIQHYEREVERTGALGAIHSLIHIYGTIGDLEAAKSRCDQFYRALPRSTLGPTAFSCLWSVLRLGDRAAEPAYLERFWRATEIDESCRHGVLASYYAEIAGRGDDALREADVAIARGCTSYGAWPKVEALIERGRYAEAAEVTNSAPMRDNYDLWRRAMALALAGEVDRAAVLARGSLDTQHPTGAVTEAENLEALYALRELLAHEPAQDVLLAAYRGGGLLDPAEHLSWAGCGYLKYGMFDEGARAVERALAARPKSPAGWACKVWSLELEERHADAVAAGEAAIASGVVDAPLENNVGLSYTRLDDYARALPHYERARELDPLDIRVYGNLASCYERLGRKSEAEAARRFVRYPTAESIAWWWGIGLVIATLALYFLAKLALIRLLPARFGHLRFP